LQTEYNTKFSKWNELINDKLPRSWFIPVDLLIFAGIDNAGTALPISDAPGLFF
jgi:hypothetical protein